MALPGTRSGHFFPEEQVGISVQRRVCLSGCRLRRWEQQVAAAATVPNGQTYPHCRQPTPTEALLEDSPFSSPAASNRGRISKRSGFRLTPRGMCWRRGAGARGPHTETGLAPLTALGTTAGVLPTLLRICYGQTRLSLSLKAPDFGSRVLGWCWSVAATPSSGTAAAGFQFSLPVRGGCKNPFMLTMSLLVAVGRSPSPIPC